MLVRRSIRFAIVLFWCLMNILFVKRQFSAPPAPMTLRSVETVTERMEEWWGVFYRGEKIGYANQTISPKANGYKILDQSLLNLQLLGTTQTAITRLDMQVDPEWTLQNFNFDLQSKELHFKARGNVTPGKLKLEVESAGYTTKQEIPLTQPPYLLAALKPYVVTQHLEEGKEHFFATFDPATLSQQVTSIVIEGREQIKIGDRSEPAIRLRQRFKGLVVTSWVDGTGRTLKEETASGLSLLRQTADQAKNFPRSGSVSLDLITQSSIVTEKPISNPTNKKLIKLKLTGVDLSNFPLADSGRQKLHQNLLEIREEQVNPMNSFPIPSRDRRFSAFLQPTPFLQSDHPKIIALAQRILAGEHDARRAAVRIKDWVYNQISKEPTVSIPNALEVLETKRGDCNEHTVLFNALARSVGIPAKTVVGIVYLRGAFYYHAWSEVWLGEWVSLDSVLNQFPADVTHVKFIEGEIDKQIDILQLIGNLKIEVIEAS